jgi:hypothetical protein
MTSPNRVNRLSEELPWYIRPFGRKVLRDCADCPENLSCLERMTGTTLNRLYLDIQDGCLRTSGTNEWTDSDLRPGIVANNISYFVNNKCNGCRALYPCSTKLAVHMLKLSARDIEAHKFDMDVIFGQVQRCADCDALRYCIQNTLDRNEITNWKLIKGYLRMRSECKTNRKCKRDWGYCMNNNHFCGLYGGHDGSCECERCGARYP